MMKKEKLPQGFPQEVYRISDNDIIKRGQRQCTEHTWRQLSENEKECIKCNTAIIYENNENITGRG